MYAVRMRRMEVRGSTLWQLFAGQHLPEIPAEGTVVTIRGGYAVVRDGVPVAMSEAEALDIVDPEDAAERRYQAASVAAGFSDRLKRVTVSAGEEWEADVAYPVGDGGLIVCERVAGRHVWIRRATWGEARAIGFAP